MEKKERKIVFGAGLVLLLIFTFTDMQISLAIAKKPFFARVLEVVGEIPFTVLNMAGCSMIVRFRNRKSMAKKWLALLGGGALFILFSVMGGFMTWNYLGDNLGEVPKILIPVIGILMAGMAVWIALKVPAVNGSKALRYAATALIYFLLVIIVMNSLKTVWGRMRFREMTDPVNEFTRWYQICGRGGFDNAYASFPSGHSMNSAGVILMLLLPDIIPALKDKKKLFRICTYTWCIVVGASRVFMGAHFASDVTVGILLSFVLFELTSTIIYKRKRRNSV
ncbi:phosphatase PAP2 family protein [Robinsoniella sp. KNHs210]|uniref:phosphatase PAP2 family protein n=1 Tax=Robinsoniella sp. KNHs210 TaxID=1469950 RepID=UPI000694DDD9|nr:phosphatase PAP2 family protein [Robinsoniella sp. KNHs210]